MKHWVFTLCICLITSLITILCYEGLSTKVQSSEMEKNYSYVVNNKDLNLGGNLREYFYSAHPTDFISAAKRSIPSVVAILAANQKSKQSNTRSNSNGSGVIISSQGHIITNLHVVDGTKDIKVVDDRGFEFEGNVIGFDKSTDLAVLKIESSAMEFLPFGNSDSLQIGEWVLAVGNPFKLHSSVTAGIVSAKGRDINLLSRQGIESFIQTDAAINPGNSGGALVNSNGELVGINTAILSHSGSYEGFSFAIPSNIVQKVAYDIIEYGSVQRGWLGVNIFNITPEIARSLGLMSNAGVLIDLVEANSAAADAGINRNDVILKVNGVATPNTAMFTEQIALYRPGDKVTLSFIRENKEYEKDVILRNQLNTTDYISVRKDKTFTDLGFEVRDLDSNEKIRLGKEGIYVVSIARGSTIHETNMDPGYIITTINGKRITSSGQLLNQLKASKGQIFLEGFYEKYPGEYPYTFYLN